MKNLKKTLLVFGLIVFASFSVANAQTGSAQVTDTTRVQPQITTSPTFDNLEDMQLYFHMRSTQLGSQKPMFLHSIRHELRFDPPPPQIQYRVGAEHIWIYNVYAVSLGFSPLEYSPGGINTYVNGRIGFPSGNSNLVKLNDAGDNAKIKSLIGFDLEFEFENWRMFNLINPIAGFGFNVLSLDQEVVENAGTPEEETVTVSNNGSSIEPFIGFRLPITNLGSTSSLGFHAKLGFPFTNSLDRVSTNNSVFFSAGFNIATRQSFEGEGMISVMNFESGVYYSAVSQTAYGQFLQPIRIVDNLSLGILGQIGSGVGTANNDLRAHSLFGVGANVRLFADNTNAFNNPYLGYLYQWFGYSLPAFGYEYGGVSSIKLGNLFKLGSSSKWFLDFSVTAPLKSEGDFITITSTDPDTEVVTVLAEYDRPFPIDVNVGLVYKIRGEKARKPQRYVGSFEVYPQVSMETLGRSIYDPVREVMEADELVETRIYVENATPEQIAQAAPMRLQPYNIDASDMKLLKFTYKASSSIDNISSRFNTASEAPRDSVVMLMVMFDRERTDVNLVNDNNMSLVFSDIRRSRYFGFNFDASKRLQPETRTDDALVLSSSKSGYYGAYSEFVKPLRWLDANQSTLTEQRLNVNQIQSDIFTFFEGFNEELRSQLPEGETPYYVTPNQYRLAYAIYPQDVFEKITSSTNDFGLSIMFNFDSEAGSQRVSDINEHLDTLGDTPKIDKNTTYYFSNVIHGSEIYSSLGDGNSELGNMNCSSTLTVDDFLIGRNQLSFENMQIVNAASKLSVLCPATVIRGYTDFTQFIYPETYIDQTLSMNNDPVVLVSQSLSDELVEIQNQWESIQSGESSVTPNELAQKALAWRRIKSVLNEMRKWNIDISSVLTEAIGIPSSDSANVRDSSLRKVDITFRD
jgi:hypothetical protein